MQLALGMTCCARTDGSRRYDYTKAATTSLRDTGGFHEPLVLYCEPGDIPVPNSKTYNFTEVRNTSVLGCFQNWRAGLTDLLQRYPEASAYMMLQDDSVWAADAAQRVRAALETDWFPSCGFISPYTSPAMVPRKLRYRRSAASESWVDANFFNKSFWGAVAICLPRASAEYLLQASRFAHHDHARKLDVVVGNVFRDADKRMMVSVPSLCDHIGAFSSLGRHKFRSIQWGRRGFQFR